MNKSELCLKCMYCCKVITFCVDASGDSLEFYKARGAIIHYDIKLPNKIYVTFPCVCPKLTPEGCSIYNKRPFACRIFDGSNYISTADHCLWNKGDTDE